MALTRSVILAVVGAALMACTPGDAGHRAADMNADEATRIVEHYAPSLASADPEAVQQAAEEMFGRRIRNQALLDIAAEKLASNYAKDQDQDLHVYAMSWLCKVLGASDNGRYKELLGAVAQAAQAKQLKGYCTRWEAKLPAGSPQFRVGSVDLEKYR